MDMLLLVEILLDFVYAFDYNNIINTQSVK